MAVASKSKGANDLAHLELKGQLEIQDLDIKI